MSRFTLNTTSTTPDALARELRSIAAKITAADLQPGADLKVGNTRIQVAVPQVDPIRQFALDNDIPVGKRGRFSKDLQERYAAHVKAERKRVRDERAAARAAKAEQAEAVSV